LLKEIQEEAVFSGEIRGQFALNDVFSKDSFYFVAERHTPVESNYRAAVNAVDLHLSINSNGENSPTLLSTQSKTLKIERCGMKYFVELELSRRQTLFE
jgi:hypothetical protein